MGKPAGTVPTRVALPRAAAGAMRHAVATCHDIFSSPHAADDGQSQQHAQSRISTSTTVAIAEASPMCITKYTTHLDHWSGQQSGPDIEQLRSARVCTSVFFGPANGCVRALPRSHGICARPPGRLRWAQAGNAGAWRRGAPPAGISAMPHRGHIRCRECDPSGNEMIPREWESFPSIARSSCS